MSKKRKLVQEIGLENQFGELSENSTDSFSTVPDPVAPSKKYLTRIKDGFENHFAFTKPLIWTSKTTSENQNNRKKSIDDVSKRPICNNPFTKKSKISTRISAYLKAPIFRNYNCNSTERIHKEENEKSNSRRCRERQSTSYKCNFGIKKHNEDWIFKSTQKWQPDLTFLKPLYFEIPNGQECFIGREKEFLDIEQALESERVIAITGSHGTGKTALVLEIVKNSCFGTLNSNGVAATSLHNLAQKLVAFHFCQIDVHINLLVHEFVHSLAAQLSQAPQLAAYRNFLFNQPVNERCLNLIQCLEDPAKALVQGILEPLNKLYVSNRIQNGPLIIIIDSLESAETTQLTSREITISQFLGNYFQYFPNWLKIILTVNESQLDLISKLSPFIIRLNGVMSNSNADVASYVNFRAQTFCVEAYHLSMACSGSFLYAKVFMDLLKRGCSQLIRKNMDPPTLSTLFHLYCESMFARSGSSFKTIVSILSTCIASLSPLTPCEIFHTVRSLDAFSGISWKSFLHSFEVLSDILLPKSDGTHTFFHPVFRYWLTHQNEQEDGKEFLCDPMIGHTAIALRMLRVESELNSEKIFELGLHLLKANIFRDIQNSNLDFSKMEFLEFLLAQSGIDFSTALSCPKNVARPHMVVSRLLFSAGGNPNSTTDNDVPLIVAYAEKGNFDMISILIQFKADLDAKNENGETALHLAAFNGNENIAGLLLLNGASMEVTDRQNHRCLDKAIMSEHISIVKLFLKRGTKLTSVTWELAANKMDITFILLHKLLNDGNTLMKELKLTEANFRYYYAFEKLKSAQNYFNKDITFKNFELTLLCQLSRCERKLQNLEKAIDFAEEAIKIYPCSSQGYFARARANQALKENRKALVDVNTAMELFSSSHFFYKSKKQLFRFKEELSRELRSVGFQEVSHKNTLSPLRRRYFL